MDAPAFLSADAAGIFTRRRALAAGHTDRDLRDWVSDGTVRRVHRGVFAMGQSPAYGSAQVLERAKAIACRHPDNLALSHHTALALHGIALYDVPWSHSYAVRLDGGVRSAPGLRVIRPRSLPPMTSVGDVRVVTAEAAVIQVASTFGLRPGLVAADSALHHGLISSASLAQELGRVGQTPGIAMARTVHSRCRVGAESPGESVLRLVVEDLGYAVELQCPITAPAGHQPFAYADLRLAGYRCLLEFDGAVKYEGISGKAALVAEKTREDRIRRLGWHVERVIWQDLESPRRLRRRIDVAIGRDQT